MARVLDPESIVPVEDLENERALVGSMLVSPSAALAAREIVAAADLKLETYRALFETICEAVDASHPLTPQTIADLLKGAGRLEAIGGWKAIWEVVEWDFSASSVGYYAERVKRASQLRQVQQLGAQMMTQARASAADPGKILNEAAARLLGIGETRKAGVTGLNEAVSDAWSAIDAAYKSGATVTGIPSGFVGLDLLTGGWQPGDLIVVGARPSQGKSAVLLEFALQAANRGAVIFFSLEMSARSLTFRRFATVSGLDSFRLRTGRLVQGEFDRLSSTIPALYDKPLLICDRGGLTTAEIDRTARRVQLERRDLAMVVVDYLGIIGGDYKSEYQAVTEKIRALKHMARGLDVPLVVAVQLNREIEHRANTKPGLSDFRDSGAVEAEADVAILIENPATQNGKGLDLPPAPDGMVNAILHLSKQRNGPRGAAEVFWDAKRVTFVDKAEREDAPAPWVGD